jgi:hypothetical protein
MKLIKDEVDTYAQYVGDHVRVPIGYDIRSGKVVWHKRELNGTVRGRANTNSTLDIRTYEIEFPHSQSDEYTANVIADKMYAQCDTDGRQYNLLEGIIDHKTDGHAVDHAYVYSKHGRNTKVRKTTKGWHFCVEWKDGKTIWERLSDPKESYPVEVSEYAVVKNLLHYPDFVWWDIPVLKKRSRIIAAVTNNYHKRIHKFGIEVVRHDKENDNTLWWDAVRK